ncbi:hypothetical protein AC579_5011 [Pseudocercospora musae]|uniref:Aflatoxin regulatory protein domain-containing protein n=1 Tax=Pseudocercospora musae TaxID=113226 RepID=A0A139I8N3_9PEZI|nr:hypothetical protein AC579_5011 [Pseudocercospora musae]
MTSTDHGVDTQASAGPGTTNTRPEATDIVFESADSILGLSAWPLMCPSATTDFNAVAGNLDCSAMREPWGSIDGIAQVGAPPVARDNKEAPRGTDYSFSEFSEMSSHAPISASLHDQLSQEQEQPIWATALGSQQISWTLSTPAPEGFEFEQCCLFRAIELVSSLHASRYVCKMANRTSSLESENRRCIDVDEALFQNRDGLATIDRILHCDKCTEDRLPLVMCCLAIEEILGWYEAVAGLTSAMDPEQPPSQDSHDNLTSPVFTRPLVMGEYLLKPSLQLAIRAKAVSSEVQERLLPLLQAIHEKHCGSSPNELGIVQSIEEHCQEMSWWCQQIIARAETVAWA